MLNLLNRNQKEQEEVFEIGKYNFLIDSKSSTVKIIENAIVDLTISGDSSNFDRLCDEDDFEFGYGIDPPIFYARDIKLNNNNEITIKREDKFDFDTAMYFMEHNDVDITLKVDNKWILISGWTHINGSKYPIVIKMKK